MANRLTMATIRRPRVVLHEGRGDSLRADAPAAGPMDEAAKPAGCCRSFGNSLNAKLE
jgi:hypothetical protein